MTAGSTLRALASAYGIQHSYRDTTGRMRYASTESVEAVASALAGRAIADPAFELRDLTDSRRTQLLEPVSVLWKPGAPTVALRVPASGTTSIDCQLELEGGRVRGWRVDANALESYRALNEDARALLPLPDLEPGYHRLHVKIGRRRASSLLICAPTRAYQDPTRVRDWGAFLPLYALRSRHSWGAGDFADLRELMKWVEGLGGAAIGTLPLLAQFYQEDLYEPSPYSPASRLMWNELYMEVESLPEFASNPPAREIAASPSFRAEVEAARSSPLVDYGHVYSLKRRVIEILAGRMTPGRRHEFERYVESNPTLRDYARFRATTERYGAWHQWPTDEPAFARDAELFHAYVQWVLDAQVRELSQLNKAGLYLDLPLGVHAAGFDVWRWPNSFVRGVSGGAPPDAFFRAGQNWGFPPLHPGANRRHGYEHLIQVVRHHLRYAGRLRIDHVMGLHRLFMIPDGFDAKDGVYVRYPAEELYAILCLESHRHGTQIVGENLGTVPRYVNQAMRRHGFSATYVLPFEIDVRGGAIRTPAAASVASLNTHDLPPFATWWSGDDVAERERMGQLSGEDAANERAARKAEQETAARFLNQNGFLAAGGLHSSDDVRRALTRFLAEGPARLVLVNLEDLWGEREPQNVPGTSSERPNWRRKARLSLEEMRAPSQVVNQLADIERARNGDNGDSRLRSDDA